MIYRLKHNIPNSLLSSEDYPKLALGDNGNVYKLINPIAYDRGVVYNVDNSTEMYSFVKADCERYIDINKVLWQESKTFEDYIRRYNEYLYSGRVMDLVKKNAKEHNYLDVFEITGFHRNDYGELIAECLVNGNMYYKKHVIHRKMKENRIVVHKNYDFKLEPCVSDKRLLSLDEQIGYFDKEMMRSPYVDLPILAGDFKSDDKNDVEPIK